tara:strand:- start:3910 stop:4590 length:681 start_codon:yes stop_codon:yes gene_type:complete
MVKDKILIIVAHSDDETIGMGGTIRKHFLKGDEVFVMSMTNGLGSRELIDKNKIQARYDSSEEASKILGFKWVARNDFPDNQMDKCSMLEIIKYIEKIKNKYKPDIVYFHNSGDLNIDHRIVSSAVLTAFRPQPKESCRQLRMFEIPSSTDYGHESITGRFSPNLYINISETWLSKLSALKAYSYEMRDYPHSRSYKSIENLAKLRGNQVGIEMAESFQIIRQIDF